eukprot:56310_1
MPESVFIILYFILSTVSILGKDFEIVITEQFNTGNYGNMFDVAALGNDIAIDNLRFAFNGCVSKSYDFYLYTKAGSLAGSAEDSSAWELACSGTTSCTWDQSVFPGSWYGETGDCAITVRAGETRALYVYSTQRGLLCYNAAKAGIDGDIGDEWTRDDNVVISLGTSGYKPFQMYSSYVTATTAQLLYSIDESTHVTPLPTPQPTAATITTDKCCTYKKGKSNAATFCSKLNSKKKCSNRGSDKCVWKKSPKCSAATPAPVTTAWPTPAPVEESYDEYELTITEKFNIGNYGNMFDITARDNAVSITNLRFAFNGCTSSSYDFYLYTKEGTLSGSEEDSTAWELACSGNTKCTWDTSVFSSWYGETGDCDIRIAAGATQALYVYSTQRGLICYNTVKAGLGGDIGDEWTRDENIIVSLGTSGYKPFQMYSSYVTATTAELMYEVEREDVIEFTLRADRGNDDTVFVYGILGCVVFGCFVCWMWRKGAVKEVEDVDTYTPLLLAQKHTTEI